MGIVSRRLCLRRVCLASAPGYLILRGRTGEYWRGLEGRCTSRLKGVVVLLRPNRVVAWDAVAVHFV